MADQRARHAGVQLADARAERALVADHLVPAAAIGEVTEVRGGLRALAVPALVGGEHRDAVVGERAREPAVARAVLAHPVHELDDRAHRLRVGLEAVHEQLDAVVAAQREGLGLHGSSSAHSRGRRKSSARRASALPGSGA